MDPCGTLLKSFFFFFLLYHLIDLILEIGSFYFHLKYKVFTRFCIYYKKHDRTPYMSWIDHISTSHLVEWIEALDEQFNHLRASSVEFPNFCTIWRMNSIFYLLVINFFKYTFNRFSIPFFISFKYYFFIHYLFIFLQLYIFQHFFIQRIIIIIGKKHLKNE